MATADRLPPVLARQETGDAIPGVTDDAVLALLLRGEAQTLYEAEEKYLDAALPEVWRLAGSPLSNEELTAHPLYRLLLGHGSRGWEDSLL
jgi:hypothetical protein